MCFQIWCKTKRRILFFLKEDIPVVDMNIPITVESKEEGHSNSLFLATFPEGVVCHPENVHRCLSFFDLLSNDL